MTGIAATGLDLYIRRSGEWVPAGFACNRPAEAEHQAVIVEKMDSAEKECLLYLPVMDQIVSLEIGVDPDARIVAADNPFRHRIVVLGSSITHGIAASRAGMAYPAQLERRTELEFINLGISGNCKLDASQARMIARISADAFVFDCFSNPLGPLIEERLAEFVAIIRQLILRRRSFFCRPSFGERVISTSNGVRVSSISVKLLLKACAD